MERKYEDERKEERDRRDPRKIFKMDYGIRLLNPRIYGERGSGKRD